MSKVGQVSQTILRSLLTDFVDRNLTANDLSDGYVGMTLSAVRQKCHDETLARSVDFDLALKDMEEGELIQTGPRVPVESPPNSGLLFVGIFESKYDYMYLTEEGYHPRRADLDL